MFKSRLQSIDAQGIFLRFYIPSSWGVPFIYIAIWSASQPSNLYSHWSSFGCLSYQGFARDGRMCCKLWGYYSEVILSLMWPTELVQCIEYGSDGYFTWIFPFLFTCTFLPHSSVFCLLVQVAYLKPSKECSLFRLLEWSASSVSILKLLSTYWAMTGKRMGLSISWGRSHMALFCVRILPPLASLCIVKYNASR